MHPYTVKIVPADACWPLTILYFSSSSAIASAAMPYFFSSAIAYASESATSHLVIHETTSSETSQPGNFGEVPSIQMMADMLCVSGMACCAACCWWVRCSDLGTMNEVVHTKWQKVL